MRRRLDRTYERALELAALLRKEAGRPDDVLSFQDREVSDWTVAQQLDHISTANRLCVGRILETLDSPRPGVRRPKLVGHLVVLTGFIPRGRGQAPEATLPSATTPQEVRDRARRAHEELAALEGRLPEIARARARREHPALGGLTPAQWIRFIEVHSRHHWKIIQDIGARYIAPDTEQRRLDMAKELRCGEIIEGCDHVVRGDSEQEVLAKGAEHARSAHGITEMDEETKKKVQAAIRDA